MNEEEKQQALEIMEKLMDHPITKPFYDIKPAENSENGSSSNKPSLNIIKNSLLNGTLSQTEWINQVKSCLSNDSNFNEKDIKYHPIILKECQKIFDKLLKRLNPNSLENWCQNVYYFHSEQIKTASHPPRKIFSIANQLDSFKKIDYERLIPISNAEIKAFQQALSMIQSEDISHGLVNIVNELQPEIKSSNTNELEFDANLYKLDLNTFRALRDYLKTELEKQGDRYPT